MLLLPVLGDGGLCDRALGCLVTAGEIGRSPRRFAVARQMTETLGPVGAGRSVQRRGPAPVHGVGFAEPAAPFDRPDAPAKARGHLRLVKSDD